MAATQTPVSDMLVTVKSREIQRGMLAEMRGDKSAACRHFLAAGHLEMVLADDYEQAGDVDLALRSQLSAASCIWRGGQQERAQSLFEKLTQNYPGQVNQIRQIVADLQQTRKQPRSQRQSRGCNIRNY